MPLLTYAHSSGVEDCSRQHGLCITQLHHVLSNHVRRIMLWSRTWNIYSRRWLLIVQSSRKSFNTGGERFRNPVTLQRHSGRKRISWFCVEVFSTQFVNIRCHINRKLFNLVVSLSFALSFVIHYIILFSSLVLSN